MLLGPTNSVHRMSFFSSLALLLLSTDRAKRAALSSAQRHVLCFGAPGKERKQMATDSHEGRMLHSTNGQTAEATVRLEVLSCGRRVTADS